MFELDPKKTSRRDKVVKTVGGDKDGVFNEVGEYWEISSKLDIVDQWVHQPVYREYVGGGWDCLPEPRVGTVLSNGRQCIFVPHPGHVGVYYRLDGPNIKRSLLTHWVECNFSNSCKLSAVPETFALELDPTCGGFKTVDNDRRSWHTTDGKSWYLTGEQKRGETQTFVHSDELAYIEEESTTMKPANFAPVYLGLYPELAEIARKHGYALAAHGTMARDFDLVAIPWIEAAGDPEDVINEITSTFAIRRVKTPSIKEHGRICYTLSVSFGECFLDFSFMPRFPRS